MVAGFATGMAAEFYVMSALHRYGLNAHLTLGNQKKIDIVIERDQQPPTTIDVKGIIGKNSWPLQFSAVQSPRHFYVFVSFVNQFLNPSASPECFIVPEADVWNGLAVQYTRGGKPFYTVSYRLLRASTYKDNWGTL